MKSRNLWPFPIVQGSCCLYQNVTLICVCGRIIGILDLAIIKLAPLLVSVEQSTDLQIPLWLFVIPASFRYLLLQLDIFHTSILLSNTLPVLVNLGRFGIEGGPFLIGLESSLVGMSWDVCMIRVLLAASSKITRVTFYYDARE
jgi:hypothetical protein